MITSIKTLERELKQMLDEQYDNGARDFANGIIITLKNRSVKNMLSYAQIIDLVESSKSVIDEK